MTTFESKVLRAVARGSFISGHGMVAWSAAARRLEKRGLLGKGRRWHLTEAGRAILQADAPTGGEWHAAPEEQRVSKRRYPRLGYDGGNIPKNATCKVCGTTEKVCPQVVQVNWFRGDDDVWPVCRECRRLPEAELLARLGYKVAAHAGAVEFLTGAEANPGGSW